MRALVCLLLLSAACSAPTSLAPRQAAIVPLQPSHPSPRIEHAAFHPPAAEPLPAGIYYRLHTYRPCRTFEDGGSICVTPTHVVVAGIHADAAGAEAMARRADQVDLAPGYPFVAHSAELGITGSAEGVAVVMGQFASQQDADEWRDALEGWLPAEVVSLLPSEAAFERLPDGEPPALAARIAGAATVTAYAGGHVVDPDGLETWWPPSESGDEPAIAKCSFAPGAVVVMKRDRPRYGYFYDWMAVSCPDGSDAWVPWRATTLGVTVRRLDDRYDVIRLVGAECDSPIFERWPLAGDSLVPPKIAAQIHASGGCAG